ncbi:MAG: hypothetical protein KAH44_07225, partial [Oricola sp.]|nr:hypothetical protein [Oricola sp.]
GKSGVSNRLNSNYLPIFIYVNPAAPAGGGTPGPERAVYGQNSRSAGANAPKQIKSRVLCCAAK